MQHVIYKYPLHSYPTEHYIPAGATFLALQVQHGEPQLWFQVPLPLRTEEQHNFVTRPTGEPYYPGINETYLGTFQLDGGALVFHVFEL